MRTLTATEVARSFSRVLDSLEDGGEEIVVTRNKHPVAKIVPGAARLTAIEVLGDLYRTLEEVEGETWLEDIREGGRLLASETRDPWE